MLNNKAFKQLAEKRSPNCVSIYVPAHPTESGVESRSFLKRILEDVSQDLVDKGMDDKKARKFLFNVYEFLQEPELWKQLNNSLAFFITEDSFESFKLPYEAGPYFYIGERFYLRPLLPAVNGTERFYLLAMSDEHTNLYEGTRSALHPIGANEIIPNNLQEALNMATTEQNVQMNRGGSAFDSPIYDNDEMGTDHHLKQYKRYAYQVDQGVRQILEDERAPLILATTDQIAPIYKDTSDYLDIAPVHISGKPEDSGDQALHSKAVEILENYHHGRQEQQAKAFKEYDKDGNASSSVFEIVARAKSGDVETLFVADDTHAWGQFSEKSDTVKLHDEQQDESVDLTDIAAVHTHLNGGKVYFMPKEKLPHNNTKVNAIYKSGS